VFGKRNFPSVCLLLLQIKFKVQAASIQADCSGSFFSEELSLKGLVEDSSGLKKKLEVLFWLLGKWVLLDLWLWHWLQQE
jgi:hypothetical protein